jgi:hypothetical protein
MKKVSSSVVLFMRTDLFTQGANKKKKEFNEKDFDTVDVVPYPPAEIKVPSLKTTRKFKIALISSYTFLISLFGMIVYMAVILDPKFPF